LKVRLVKNSFSGRGLKQAVKSTIGNFLNIWTFLTVILFAIAVSWIPDGLAVLLNRYLGNQQFPYFQTATGIFVLVILFIAGNIILRRNYPRVEIFSEEAPKKENLIIFLSPSNTASQIKSFEDFKKVKTPWQMPAVAVRHHLPKLKNLFVILSNESKKNFEDFKQFINQLFPDNNINIHPVGLEDDINFENMEDLKEVIEKVYEKNCQNATVFKRVMNGREFR